VNGKEGGKVTVFYGRKRRPSGLAVCHLAGADAGGRSLSTISKEGHLWQREKGEKGGGNRFPRRGGRMIESRKS